MGPTPSPAQRQIRPPPVSQHLREFAANPHAWAVLGRNLIPVVGIYAFKWSAALAVFNYWFDGLVAVAAITAAVVPRAVKESAKAGIAGGRGGGLADHKPPLIIAQRFWVRQRLSNPALLSARDRESFRAAWRDSI